MEFPIIEALGRAGKFIKDTGPGPTWTRHFVVVRSGWLAASASGLYVMERVNLEAGIYRVSGPEHIFAPSDGTGDRMHADISESLDVAGAYEPFTLRPQRRAHQFAVIGGDMVFDGFLLRRAVRIYCKGEKEITASWVLTKGGTMLRLHPASGNVVIGAIPLKWRVPQLPEGDLKVWGMK